MSMTASEAIEFVLQQPKYSAYSDVLRPILYKRAQDEGLLPPRHSSHSESFETDSAPVSEPHNNEERNGTIERLDCV